MIEVEHQPEQLRFIVPCEGGPAVLDYQRTADGGVDFHHTWVPPMHRGSAIAPTLVKAGLAWAQSEALAIQASCWYVQRFLPGS